MENIDYKNKYEDLLKFTINEISSALNDSVPVHSAYRRIQRVLDVALQERKDLIAFKKAITNPNQFKKDNYYFYGTHND